MATPTTRTPPTSANPSAQPSSRPRDWSKLRSAEPGSNFGGIRGRGRGGARGGRGGGRPPGSPAIKDGKLPRPSESHGPQPDISTPKAEPPPVRKGLAQSSTASTTPEKPTSAADRAPKPKTPSRRASRSVPVLTVAPASPTPDSVTNVPSTPSRNPSRRRKPQQQHTKPPLNGTGNSVVKSSIPSSTSLHPQKPRATLVPSPIVPPRKDVPPHLAAAHEAEIRHGIDAFVEHVRAVAMAENRPSTPGSHIDWAGDEDDSLPDLDDWGVTTTNTSTGDKEEGISPILADALRPLPEPQTEEDAENENGQDVESSDNNDDGASEPSPLSNAPDIQDISFTATDAQETPIVAASETITQFESPSPRPSLSAKPVAATENLRPSSAPVLGEEPLAATREGLSQSIHAPSPTKGDPVERTLSSSSSEHGLAASIHAPKNFPESHSAPSLLNPGAPASGRTFGPSHGRSKTEGRGAFLHPRTMPAAAANQRAARSGTSSPLGPHAPAHGRNHSTPPGVAGQRASHSSRPVITGEAISRLARTIGGIPVIPRAQGVAVAKD